MALPLPLSCGYTGSPLQSDAPALSGVPSTSSSASTTFWCGRSSLCGPSRAGNHQRQVQSKHLTVAISRKRNLFSTICAAAKPDRNAGAGKPNSTLTITDAEIVVAPAEDDDKLRIRVDVSGQSSQRAFDIVLKDLAKNAPPVPGFRKAKGGKTSMVPLNVAYQFIGPKAVRKFVIDEIIKSTLGDYVQKESIKVKNELKTDQSGEELLEVFEPGKAFGFDATLDLESPAEIKEEGEAAADEEAVSPPQTVEAST